MQNRELFYHIPKLEILHASSTDIGKFIGNNSDVFSKNLELKELILADSIVKSFPSEIFKENKKLEKLDLGNNHLEDMHIQLNSLAKLNFLDIKMNEIKTLDVSFTDGLEELFVKSGNFSLNLEGNPVSCSCRDLPFIKWMKETGINLINRGNYKCIHPQTGETLISNVQVNNLELFCFPPPNYMLYLTASITPVAAVLIVGLALYIYKKRWPIRFWVYFVRHRRKIALEAKGDYIYDAFFIFNEKEHEWVANRLLKTMECTPYNLKFCLHYRNFKPGNVIEEEVVNAIEQSRKTVLVLSPDFQKSNWCDFEMHMARNKLFSDGKDVLVLIILRKLEIGRVSRTLRNLLDKKSYLEWPNDPEGEDLFWNKLNLALCPGGISIATFQKINDNEDCSSGTSDVTIYDDKTVMPNVEENDMETHL